MGNPPADTPLVGTGVVLKLTKQTATNWDDLMFDQRFFNRLGLLISPIAIQVIFKECEWTEFTFLMKMLNIWIVISALLIISSVLDGITGYTRVIPWRKTDRSRCLYK